MMAAAEAEQFEAAARLRDQLSTVHQLQEKQRIATAEQDDEADVFGYHFEDGALAVNLFHVRAGKDRRPPRVFLGGFAGSAGRPQLRRWSKRFWRMRSTRPFHAGAVFSALLKQLYIDQQYVPRTILVPVDFDDRETLAALLTERTGHRIELAVPQRGEKRSLVDLAGQNAKQSYTQRFRVLEPSRKAIQETLADTLMLPELPRRIECFDISHIQGAETVASLVVWEDGKMNKQLYRKFKVMTVLGVDDFASMREVVTRRYRRLLDQNGNSAGKESDTQESNKSGAPSFPRLLRKRLGEHESQPSGSLKGTGFSRTNGHPKDRGALAPEGKTLVKKNQPPSPRSSSSTAASASSTPPPRPSNPSASPRQPLASIAKREEVIYLYGNEDEPIVLDRRSPVLHLVQLIRDESHRFAIGYHRQRRAMRDRDSELLNIPGVGPQTRQRLLTHFGSLRDVQQATAESLAAVVPRKTAETIWRHFHETQPAS